MSLRQRQIREVLDEDLKFYREVYARELKQAKLMNEVYAPPSRFERRVAFQLDQYFIKLQRYVDDVVNALVSGDYTERGVKDMLYTYQELITYLDTYISHAPLNQRDIAVIENKFDAISPSIEEVSGYAMALGWKSSKLIDELNENLTYRTYRPLSLIPQSTKQVSKEMMESGFNNPVQGLDRREQEGFYMDTDAEFVDDEEEDNEVSDLDEIEERIDSMEKRTPRKKFEKTRGEIPERPKNRKEAQEYIKKIPIKEFKELAKELGFLDELIAKKTTSSLKSRPTLEQMLQMYILKEQGIKTMRPVEATPEPANVLEEEGEELLEEEEEEEEEEEVEGSGVLNLPAFFTKSKKKEGKSQTDRIKSHMKEKGSGKSEDMNGGFLLRFLKKSKKKIEDMEGGFRDHMRKNLRFTGEQSIKPKIEEVAREEARKTVREHPEMSKWFGSGESEDMMFGAPAGQKKAMKLRPMDKQPVHFKTQDERGEKGLSLEDRMSFLNQLETQPIKEELKINNTSTYKKSIAEKYKKLSKK